MSPDPDGPDSDALAEELLSSFLSGPNRTDAQSFEELCGAHPNLESALRRLKAEWDEVENLAGQVQAHYVAEKEPDRIGDFALRSKIGEGGMGSVYLAEQEHPIRRLVAIKVVRSDLDSEEVLKRFDLERQALARMNHPNIARVFDAGATEDGRPYFVMEYVPGISITKYCDRKRMTTPDRLRLFADVCEAIHHAHQKGIIHRDIKPPNVLVFEQDASTVAKVIDFGIAKATDPSLSSETLFTRHGQCLGTPEYMSPEQTAGKPLDVDTRSDIYSLGVLLYELLSGQHPLDVEGMREHGYEALLKAVREDNPLRPSTRVRGTEIETNEAASNRREVPASLSKKLKGDLDWITMKALDKEPNRRYASAAELADDIRRHMENAPVVARPPSSFYLARKFVRRHRGVVFALGAVFLSLIIGLLTTLNYYVQAQEATDRESQAKNEALEAHRKVLSLSDATVLEELREEAETLWPRRKEKVAAMDHWLLRAEALQRDLDHHEQFLRELRSGDAVERETVEHQWLERLLDNLVVELKAFFEPEQGLASDVRHRRTLASKVEDETVVAFEDEWVEAIDAIAASSHYGGLELSPQVGLIPLGPDPESGLWEFWLWESGERPTRQSEGSAWEVGSETGLILVLIPGGTFLMGGDDRLGFSNYDPQSRMAERPVHEVTLDPFFLSKYEWTRAQWIRVVNADPSFYRVLSESERYPVESIDWDQACEGATRLGLQLPTEAQWEYAARAGATTPWVCGDRKEDLIDYANVADALHKETRISSGAHETWRDGFKNLAPVGSFLPNAFGLFDIHGNVWEWCLDPFLGYDKTSTEPGSGRRLTSRKSSHYIYRGGSFMHAAEYTRLSSRGAGPGDTRAASIGLRPARVIEPGED